MMTLLLITMTSDLLLPFATDLLTQEQELAQNISVKDIVGSLWCW